MSLFTTPEEYFRLKLKNCPAKTAQKVSLAGETPVVVLPSGTPLQKIQWIIISAAIGTGVAFLLQYMLTRGKR